MSPTAIPHHGITAYPPHLVRGWAPRGTGRHGAAFSLTLLISPDCRGGVVRIEHRVLGAGVILIWGIYAAGAYLPRSRLNLQIFILA